MAAIMKLSSILAVAFLAPCVLAHSALKNPQPRSECSREEDPPIKVTLTGGTGMGHDGDTYQKQWGGVPGPCGDPWAGENPDEFTFENYLCPDPFIRGTYEEGGTLLTTQDLRGNHGGFFKCEICDDPDDMSETCFQKNQLNSTLTGTPRWYIPDTNGDHLDMEWHLPEGLTCEHCVLSCQYITAQHCWIACDEEECGPIYAAHRNPAQHQDREFEECVNGEFPEFQQSPQIFRNCADITITPNDGSGTPTPNPALIIEEPEENAVQAPEEEIEEVVQPPEPVNMENLRTECINLCTNTCNDEYQT